MNRNKFAPERAVAIVGFLFLVVAVITGFMFDGDPESIIERVADTSIVIPWVHVVCASVTLILIFKHNDYVMIGVLFVESALTILTDYRELGIFFFYASFILMMSKGLLKTKVRYAMLIMFILHIVTILLSYTHGWKTTFIALGYSAFSMVFYVWIYCLLKARLSCFFPQNVVKNEILADIKAGSVIKLSDYNLNERQSKFLLDNLHNKLSYKEISEKYFVSISTVKKDFADVFKIFNVSNIEELRILLLQYQVEA